MELTINGRKVTAAAGATVLDVATAAGVYIPTLCHDRKLRPYGACRLCLVSIGGMRGLPASCVTKVAEGMVVQTETPEISRVRKMILEMIVADHPLDCLTCKANQQCELQRVTAHLGTGPRRMMESSRKTSIDNSNPFYFRDMEKCIMCARCVRACQGLRCVGAIDIAGRGYDARISAFADLPISESNCESCGECVDVCPTGALLAKSETVLSEGEVTTTCPYCGVGCGLVLGVKGNSIVQVRGEPGHPASRGSLCVKGRFGLDFVGSRERLTKPLIRRNGKLEEAEWEVALDLVASKFSEIKAKHGPNALAGLSSAKCTNEENYIFQKLVRAGFGTNNVDHCARLCHASTVAGLAQSFGSGAMTNSISELADADCIFVIGSNTTEAHPVIALRLKEAVHRGAKLIVADPRRIDLVRLSELYLRHRSGTDVALINGMMNAIITEGLANTAFIDSFTEGYAGLKESVMAMTPEVAAGITGVPADDIRAAARLYAKAGKASIVYSMGITQHSTGTDNVMSLANLAMLAGQIGRPSTGVNPLRGQNNVQGACDMGALPNVLPGYQPVGDETARNKFGEAWGVKLDGTPGLTVVEILHAAQEGKIRGLYVVGENIALSDPNINRACLALKSVEFLVVQDLFLSETAEFAHVVLPAASFAEKDGTFTNTERRVQRVRKAVEPPGQAREDFWIIAEIAGRMGLKMSYRNPAEIMEEVARLTPIYGGIDYLRIEGRGLQWPCRDAAHPGTVYLHQGGAFTRGKGRFIITPYQDAAELPDREYPYLLTTGRYLEHFHTGTMTRKSPGLEELAPPVPFEINIDDAEKDGIKNGDKVVLESRRGKLTAWAMVSDRSPKGTIFMAFHYKEAAANLLTNDALDPVAKIPEYKVCAVRIVKSSIVKSDN